MMLSLVLKVGLLAQVPVLSTAGAHSAPSGSAAAVRVWLNDSSYQVGARARVFVNLRDPGYLVVLHADAAGRIRVLFPLSPDEPAQAPAGATLQVSTWDDQTAFVVPAGSGMGTVVAVRSRTPLRFDDLRNDSGWDYANSLLFQPTAGNRLAALLDIADRMAGDARYQYDVATYRTPQTSRTLATTPRPPLHNKWRSWRKPIPSTAPTRRWWIRSAASSTITSRTSISSPKSSKRRSTCRTTSPTSSRGGTASVATRSPHHRSRRSPWRSTSARCAPGLWSRRGTESGPRSRYTSRMRHPI